MKLSVLTLLLFLAAQMGAQTTPVESSNNEVLPVKRYYTLPDATPFGATILAEDMKWLIDTLASDAMAGRETGEEGQRRAAEFIAGQFEELGLPPVADRNTYFQNIHLQRESWKSISLKVGEREFKNRNDYYVYSSTNPDNPKITVKDVVFVGYGIEDGAYSDYGNMNVAGKAVIFYDGEPLDAAGKSMVTGKDYRSSWSLDWKRKVKLATAKGASMVFIIDSKISENVRANRRELSTRGWRPYAPDMASPDGPMANNVFISQEIANAIFEKKVSKMEEAMADLKGGKGFKAQKFKSNIEVQLSKDAQTLEGSNVVGFIEGSDEYLKNQYVIITAHYDHLGQVDDVVYNGADDNASGTSGVIEIARAFAAAKKAGVGPKRTVVCMLVSGEEKGLLGSRFYVDFPLFPLDRTVVNINIDMIGRIDDRHANNPDYIYVIGSDRLSSELHEINEFANTNHTKLELDYKYNALDDPNHYYERSDHYNFAERGIPAIFYFNGTHADYHKASDTREKIDAAAAAKRAQLAFYTAWDIANRPAAILVDKKK